MLLARSIDGIELGHGAAVRSPWGTEEEENGEEIGNGSSAARGDALRRLKAERRALRGVELVRAQRELERLGRYSDVEEDEIAPSPLEVLESSRIGPFPIPFKTRSCI